MITTQLAYHAPSTVSDAVAWLAEKPGDTAVLGGSTVVVPDLTHGRTRVTRILDLRRVGLRTVRSVGGTLVVGAMTTYSDLLADDRVHRLAPLLQRVARGITGGPQIRNRGTVGGSACYANPSSDLPACLVALGARLRLAGPDGTREVAAAIFFNGAFRTDRAVDEILVEVVLPEGPASRFGYHKLKRCESSWPIATAAYAEGSQGARLILGGVAASPVTVPLEGIVVNATSSAWPESAWPEAVLEAVTEALPEPWSDVLAPGWYRQRVAGVVATRALREALA